MQPGGPAGEQLLGQLGGDQDTHLADLVLVVGDCLDSAAVTDRVQAFDINRLEFPLPVGS